MNWRGILFSAAADTIMKNGVIIFNDAVYKQFADVLLYLAPRFPMDSYEIVRHIKTKGFDSFIAIADEYDPGISESVELLIRHGKGGTQHGKG